MKKIQLVALFILSVSIARAQHVVSGVVTDGKGSSLPGINVLMLAAGDSSLVKGGITNVEGQFRLDNLKAGAYVLVFRSVGYKTISNPLALSATVELPAVRMEEETAQLGEVVVMGQKSLYEQKMDRLVINVQGSATSAGGTALEVLERSPGVQVNRVNNSLVLNGKEEVMVMINGKVSRQSVGSLMQLLNGMSASNIEKIELITNPSAKYEAGSNGGIINIQLAQSTDVGTNGAVTVSGGYGRGEKAGLSLNLNRRNDKVNWYSDFSYNRDHTYQYVTNDRTIRNGAEVLTARTVNDRDPVSTNFNGKVGMDYTLGKRTVIGSFISGFSNLWDMRSENSGLFSSTAAPATAFEITSTEKGRLKHLIGNLNVNHKTGRSGVLDFNADYLYYGDKNTTDYLNLYRNESGETTDTEVLRANKITPMNIVVSNLDYSTDLGKNVKLETGLKGIVSRLENNVSLNERVGADFVPNDEFTEDSRLNEKIGAAFASVKYRVDDKTNLDLGLRYEYSETTLDLQDKGNVVDLTYGKLFPSLFISRKLAAETSLQLSLGRRITRPSFSDLAPFFIFLDPSTYFLGNTSLRPSINDNVKLGMQYKRYLLAMEYTRETNAISRYQPVLVEETNQQMFTSLNLNYRNTLSLMLTVPVDITPRWNVNLSLLGVNRQLETQRKEVLSQNYYTLNLSQSYSFPSGYSLEMTGFYNSESLDGISRLGAFYNLNLGVRKRFKNDSQLSLAVNNMFDFENRIYTTDGLVQNYATNTLYQFETWKFRVAYLFKFGNTKLKDKNNRSTGSEEIQKRMN